MKKLLTCIAVLASACAVAMAQTTIDEIEDAKSVESENEVFSVEGLSNLRIGTHYVTGNEYISEDWLKSRHFALNAVELSIKPASWVGFTAGVDLNFDMFRAAGDYKFGIGPEGSIPVPVQDTQISKSKIKFFSLGFPLLLDLKARDCGVRLGVECMMGLSAKAKNYIPGEGKRDTVDKIKGGKPKGITWNPLAEVYFDGFGIYYRYSPSPIVANGDLNISGYHTVGIVLGI